MKEFPGNIEALVQIEDGAAWLHAQRPRRVLEARLPAEVPAAIREAEALAVERGWLAIGFVAYEAGIAYGLSTHPPTALPLAWFALFDPEDPGSVARRDRPDAGGPYETGPIAPSIDRAAFAGALDRIHAAIAAGDTYQVNYTFRMRGTFRGDPRGLFADLATAQRPRHGAYVNIGTHAICSASPELFFARRDGEIVARPMKGTAPRGRTTAEDAALGQGLAASPKQRAENVMIVDMMRNDLGRIAEIGSVGVPALFELERYPNVWQMTSTVRGRTVAALPEIFAALHPSASVTGAPKVRTMDIIRELESDPRGVYTGAIGYVTPAGDAHFSVAIRTAVVDLTAGRLEFGVGSGIVWDSATAEEYDECLVKAAVLGRRPQSFQLLETLRWTPAEEFFLLNRHLERLRDSADYFGFAFDAGRLRAALEAAVGSSSGPLRVRLLLDEDGAARAEAAPLDAADEPVRVALAAEPVDERDVFLFHKTTNRGVYERARRPGFDDVILWNTRREITESTIANIVIAIGGRKVTPPVACGLLAGTFRAELLARADIVEDVVTVDDLRRADDVWLINSVRAWRRAVVVD